MPVIPRQALEAKLMELSLELQQLKQENSNLLDQLEEQRSEWIVEELMQLLNSQELPPQAWAAWLTTSEH